VVVDFIALWHDYCHDAAAKLVLMLGCVKGQENPLSFLKK
jgi:hypothetical protein